MNSTRRNALSEAKEAAARLTKARLGELDQDGNPVFAPSYPNGYRHDVHPELDEQEEESSNPLAKARAAKAAKAAEAKAKQGDESDETKPEDESSEKGGK
jgi:hypothetical protein